MFGNQFEILSDHQPLQWAFKVKDPSSRLLCWRLKVAEYDCLIKHISGKDNVVADVLSRIKAINTRQKIKQIKPFEHRPFQMMKNIAVLSSWDKLMKNPFFSKLRYTISKVNEIKRCQMGNKTIYLVFYRDSARSQFSTSSFRAILQTLKELLLKHNIIEIGLYDDFNAVSKYRLSLIEQGIIALLQPIQPVWTTLG